MQSKIDVEVIEETQVMSETTRTAGAAKTPVASPSDTRPRSASRSLGGIPLSGRDSPVGDKNSKAAERAAKQAAFEETLELKKQLAVPPACNPDGYVTTKELTAKCVAPQEAEKRATKFERAADAERARADKYKKDYDDLHKEQMMTSGALMPPPHRDA